MSLISLPVSDDDLSSLSFSISKVVLRSLMSSSDLDLCCSNRLRRIVYSSWCLETTSSNSFDLERRELDFSVYFLFKSSFSSNNRWLIDSNSEIDSIYFSISDWKYLSISVVFEINSFYFFSNVAYSFWKNLKSVRISMTLG